VAGDVRGRALLHDSTAFEDDESIGKNHCVEWVVSHDDGAAAKSGQMASKLGTDLGSSGHIQRRHRLVQQEQSGLAYEGARQGDTLRLATRQPRWLRVGHLAEADLLKPSSRTQLCLLVSNAAASEPELHVRQCAQVWEQSIVLEDDANRPPLDRHMAMRGDIVKDVTKQLDATGLEGRESGQRPQGRGLPRSVRPQKYDDLARMGRYLNVEAKGAVAHLD
jgi:hypothetical protein